MTSSRSVYVVLALLGVAALALAGCGRKSGLDLPPTAGASPTATQETSEAPAPGAGNPLSWTDPASQSAPTAAKGQKRRFVLDPLLD